MPSARSAGSLSQNIDVDGKMTLFYQINYTLTDVPEDCGYFPRPVPADQSAALQKCSTPSSTALKVRASTSALYGLGRQQQWLVGARAKSNIFMDGDAEFPTICGTAPKIISCGSTISKTGQQAVSGIQHGLRRLPRSSAPWRLRHQMRFGLYRWHIWTPRSTPTSASRSSAGLGPGGDISRCRTTSPVSPFWYQTLPSAPSMRYRSKDSVGGHLV